MDDEIKEEHKCPVPGRVCIWRTTFSIWLIGIILSLGGVCTKLYIDQNERITKSEASELVCKEFVKNNKSLKAKMMVHDNKIKSNEIRVLQSSKDIKEINHTLVEMQLSLKELVTILKNKRFRISYDLD